VRAGKLKVDELDGGGRTGGRAEHHVRRLEVAVAGDERQRQRSAPAAHARHLRLQRFEAVLVVNILFQTSNSCLGVQTLRACLTTCTNPMTCNSLFIVHQHVNPLFGVLVT